MTDPSADPGARLHLAPGATDAEVDADPGPERQEAGRNRPASAAAPDLVTLSAVRFRRTVWIRRGWVALGKLTLLDGMPDVGKSTIAGDWIARATTGRPFPGGGSGFGEPIDVLSPLRPRTPSPIRSRRGSPRLGAISTGFTLSARSSRAANGASSRSRTIIAT